MARAPKLPFYMAEPADKPLRMACSGCGVLPGVKCVSSSGRGRDNYHPIREHDFNVLRKLEAKLKQWEAQYGKVGTE